MCCGIRRFTESIGVDFQHECRQNAEGDVGARLSCWLTRAGVERCGQTAGHAGRVQRFDTLVQSTCDKTPPNIRDMPAIRKVRVVDLKMISESTRNFACILPPGIASAIAKKENSSSLL